MTIPSSFTVGDFFAIGSDQEPCRRPAVDDVLVVPYFSQAGGLVGSPVAA